MCLGRLLKFGSYFSVRKEEAEEGKKKRGKGVTTGLVHEEIIMQRKKKYIYEREGKKDREGKL